MFKRRDIPPVLLLLLLIVLVMLTLSQILVVHSGRYGKNMRSMRRLQQELRDMDLSLHSLMHQNVPSVERSRRMLQNHINSGRFAEILAQASAIDAKGQTSKVKANSSRPDFRQRNHARTLNAASLTRRKTESPSADAGNSTQGYVVQEPEVSRVSVPEVANTTSEIRQRVPGREADVTPRNVINYCPSVPPFLKGRLSVNVGLAHNVTVAEVMRKNPEILPGGKWRPRECVARHKVAVIIPYRDREDHLILLLSQLHPVLQRQQLDYRIFVVEQFGADTFNKARIMNIGFVEALKMYDFHCFIFHDVDLVPEDDRNMYSCPVQPRHMSVAIDEMGYRLAYQELVGGVLNMRTSHFQRLNGYSNLYWGWGAEDDDMAYRIMHVGLRITRPQASIARYKMIKHPKRKPSDWRKRAKLLYTVTRRIQYDGLNSLTYRLVQIRDRPLYTHILAEIGKPPRGFRDNKSSAS